MIGRKLLAVALVVLLAGAWLAIWADADAEAKAIRTEWDR